MTNHSASPLKQPDGLQIATTAIGLAAPAVKILEGRGLDVELAVRMGWRSSKAINGSPIEIPYYLNGVEVNHKWRTLSGGKRFSQKDGGVKCFYNADIIQEWQSSEQPLVICEGEMDCLVALQLGFMAVSVPDGGPAKSIKGESKKYSYLDDFPTKGEVILCTDNDGPGINLMNDLAARLGRYRCKWVRYPEGCKDLNDVLRLGEQEARNLLNSAEWMKVDGVYLMSELPPLTRPECRALSFMPVTFRKRDFSLLTGYTSNGKSTFMNFAAHDLTERGWRVCFASFEQEPQYQHKASLTTLLNGREEEIDRRYSFIVPDVESDEDCNLGWLLEKMASAVKRHNVDMFIIDPFNEIEHDYSGHMSETKYIGWAIRQLKKFARRHNVHVMVVAHPPKPNRNKDGEFPIPTPYDVSGSSQWADKPELIFIVHIQNDMNTLVRVAKSRYHDDIGEPGDYIFEYDKRTRRYTEPSARYSMA